MDDSRDIFGVLLVVYRRRCVVQAWARGDVTFDDANQMPSRGLA
jgi:hypothetical protein